MLVVARTLFAACGFGIVPPARPMVRFGMMPASKTTLPSVKVSGAMVPLPSLSRETAEGKPRALALKSPV